MGLFSRRRGEKGGRKATKDDLAQLREWATARTGVEAFVEPQTSVTQTTLLLVASDGEFTRRRFASPQAAADFARKVGIPVYDTNRVGYPQRMRDYSMRVSGRGEGPSTSASGAAYTTSRSPRERAAISALESIAGVGQTTGEPDDEELRRIWRLARSRSHPDRRGGDRTAWDEVETAARTLGLQGEGR
ncbi:hypothetical protein [Aeromicrobium sp.]|uniref:hypothetical protein n=1 Tax=Aeromicrobium sp. TaxID=1871063 RepID=UPI003D6ADF4C